MKRILALAVAVVALGVAGVMAQSGNTANVEVRVWQRVSDAESLYISARPEGGSWRTLGTIPIAMSGLSESGRYHYGDITVTVPRASAPAVVEVRVWQQVSNALGLFISARPRGGSWSTLGTIPLDMSGRSSTGTFRYGDIALAVPLSAMPTPTPAPTSTPTPSATCQFSDAATRVVASTVKVTTSSGTGSAFYIGNSEFVTAGHLVDDARTVTLTNARINTTASVVGYFPGADGDVAILRASSVRLAPLDWAGSLGIGDTVAFAGYPQGFGTNASISRGVVSRFYTEDGISFIQTDAQVNSGNSGGPLFDECGRVAGVASWKIVRSRSGSAAEGLGFAVADPSLNRLLTSIRAGGGATPGSSPSRIFRGSPTWGQIDAFVDAVDERWNEAISKIDTLQIQWDASATTNRPSERLAQIAREQTAISRDMKTFLDDLKYHHALNNDYAHGWRVTARSYWRSQERLRQEMRKYALGGPWTVVEEMQDGLDAVYASHLQAQCDLFRLQRYPNAGRVCAEAGR